MKPHLLPTLRLEGIKSLTDETGMFQHTKYSTIIRREGYTTDDNARALIAALKHYKIYGEQQALELANIYLTFLLHMQRTDGLFHNLLGFDRRFLDEVGSEDSIGRAIWACGYALNSKANNNIELVAKEMFDRGLPSSVDFTSPRAEAFTIIGLHNYNKAFPEDVNIVRNIELLARRLINRYQKEATKDWRWFEPYLTYANPRLPQALFFAYESTRDPELLSIAECTLRFLTNIQIVRDIFIPIGTRGWYVRDRKRAQYDQQPIEASCMVDASLTALKATGDEKYKETARIAHEWFHGRNTKEVKLYNHQTGTCYDGITPKGLNLNQGAEATLSYYLSYLALKESKLI